MGALSVSGDGVVGFFEGRKSLTGDGRCGMGIRSGERRGGGGFSLDMLRTVGRAVVLLVGDEGGEAAELDVAEAAVARVAILHGRRHVGRGSPHRPNTRHRRSRSLSRSHRSQDYAQGKRLFGGRERGISEMSVHRRGGRDSQLESPSRGGQGLGGRFGRNAPTAVTASARTSRASVD